MKRINEICGYENVSDSYWITTKGEVLSERMGFKPLRQRITKPTKKSRNRYYEICLFTKERKKIYVKTHRLVAKAFIDNPNNLAQVNHLDEDGLNNCVENLEWCSAKDNSRYSNSKKLYCYDINGLVKIYDTMIDCKEDGFNPGHVGSIARGSIAKGRNKPILRHKNHTFSYEPLSMESVVQRLSKPPFYKG